MLQLKHEFTSPKLDDLDATLVQPSDWNNTHTLQMSGLSVIGKHTAGNGDAEALLIGEGLVFDGATLRVDPVLIAGLLTFATRADYVAPAHPSLVLVQHDETRGGIVTLYMYDGSALNLVPTTTDYALAVAAAAASASAAALSATNAAGSKVGAETAASSAAASWANFQNRYLGPKASDPTTDNYGGALTIGALYYNTAVPEMRQYNGSAWTVAYMTSSGPFNGPHNGTLGVTTPAEARVTTLEVSSTLSVAGALSGAGFVSKFASPPAIGTTSPAAGVFTTLTAQLAQFTSPKFTMIREPLSIVASAVPSSLNFDARTYNTLYYQYAPTSNWGINVRGDSSNTLDSMMNIGESVSIGFLAPSGGTYALTAFAVDGVSRSIYWPNGVAPAGGSGFETYMIAIFKNGANSFFALATHTSFS